MKKIVARGLALAFVGSLLMAGNAMANQMLWQETDNDILVNGWFDTSYTLFSDMQKYEVSYHIDDPGYNELGFRMGGVSYGTWDDENSYNASYIDTFYIEAYLDGALVDSGTWQTINGNGDFFHFSLGMDEDDNFVGDLTIRAYADVTGIDEKWALQYAELSTCDPVPEPATMLLFGTGLAGLAGFRRRKTAGK